MSNYHDVYGSSELHKNSVAQVSRPTRFRNRGEFIFGSGQSTPLEDAENTSANIAVMKINLNSVCQRLKEFHKIILMTPGSLEEQLLKDTHNY